jgi:hypothetical protein
VKTFWRSLNRVVRPPLALIVLAVGAMGSGGGSCCGQTKFPPPPTLDVVWCDFTAVPCLTQTRNADPNSPDFRQPNGCVGVPCTTTAGASCDTIDPNVTPQGTGPTDFSSCDPATCQTKVEVVQDSGGGYRQCFDHKTGMTAAQACQQLCNPNPTFVPKGKASTLDNINDPPQPNIRSRCTATVDFGLTPSHPPYNGTSEGTKPDYLANGCMDPGPLLGDPAGTNRVVLGGAGTFSSPDNAVAPSDVAINGGFFNVDATNTTCNALQTFCPAFVNQWEIMFDDFAPNVQGTAHPTTGLHLSLDQPFRTTSGTFFPAGGGLPPTFSFELPPGVVFDSIGTVDGNLSGLNGTSDQATNGTIDLSTGEVVVDFDLTESVDGHAVNVTGTATSAQVFDVAPVVTAPATQSIDATTACTVNVTLAPTATSLVGLPVSFRYAVDGAFKGTGASKTVSLGIGSHTALMVGIDSAGGQAEASETITVNDKTAPVFGTVPPAQTVQTCSNAAGTIHVTVPTAQDACTQAAATVTGTVTQLNGASVSIPITNGTVNVAPGVAVIHWVATNASGVTAAIDQTLTIVGPPTFFGSHGVTIADRGIVNGSVYAGAGSVTSVGNDAAVNGNLISASPVLLHDRTAVTLIDTNAGLTRGNSDVLGAVLTTTPVLPAFPTISQTFTGTQTITVAVGGSRPLAPGQYGAVTVFSSGRLVLSAGTYAFTSLDLEPQATLVTPSATGETAQLFVRDSVIYRGRAAIASGTLAPLFLGYTGSNAITIESPYTGTIVAPSASLTLQSLNNTGVYAGEFFARTVNLSPATTTNSSPFTCH